MKWYSWKIWRLAYSRNRVGHVVEGNNRWNHVGFGFFWRYDNTKSGTKD